MTFVIDSKGVVRDVLSSVLNFKEHVSFVQRSLVAIEAEEKKTPETKPMAEEVPTEVVAEAAA